MQAHPLLSRRPHRPAPAVILGHGATLSLARLHEGCGPARRSFAMLLAAQMLAGPAVSGMDGGTSGGRSGATSGGAIWDGPIWWIAPAWQSDQLHAEGVASFIPPERLIFVRPKRAEDVLWTLEEILRSGTARLAVADIPGLPSLTAVRRLHLAAETGAENGPAPLGLILTPGPGGAQGVESRWHCAPDHAAGQPGWRLDRLRARMDPPRSWRATWGGQDPQNGSRRAGLTLTPAPPQTEPAMA
ncbi:ImuA family protein [Pseudooceanicola sp. MF1-13]|uniref:ImuA family protein n=1 Tax=Pseudooceanicola sp. MF1-13 TaxID=3379095 RepID=UPI0038911EE1